jgi:hypothetical protein
LAREHAGPCLNEVLGACRGGHAGSVAAARALTAQWPDLRAALNDSAGTALLDGDEPTLRAHEAAAPGCVVAAWNKHGARAPIDVQLRVAPLVVRSPGADRSGLLALSQKSLTRAQRLRLQNLGISDGSAWKKQSGR